MGSKKREHGLTTLEVIEEVRQAMADQRPLSVVRVGDGENLCLSQFRVWPIQKVLSTRWGRLSRTTNWKGVRLPNIELRDQLIESIKKADIVGIPYRKDKEILAEAQLHLRSLTDACFAAYNIVPAKVCHTFVNRHMVEYQEFWEMLKGKKVAVISRWGKRFKELISQRYEDFDIDFVKVISFNRYEEIPKVIRKMKSVECDIVFISAGVSAVILAQKLAKKQGRVAIDFGKSAVFMVKKNRKVQPWIPSSERKPEEEQEIAQTASTRQEVHEADAADMEAPLESGIKAEWNEPN